MGCGCGIFSLLKSKETKNKKTEIVNTYYIKEDNSTRIKDSVIQRSNIGEIDTFKVCPYCGKKLELPSEPIFCPYCGKRMRGIL